jgi:hypothetical protein
MRAVDPSDDVRQHVPLPRRVPAGYSLGSLVTGPLAARGWHPRPRLAYEKRPPTMHLTVNALLNARPAPALREALLTGFLSLLQRPGR